MKEKRIGFITKAMLVTCSVLAAACSHHVITITPPGSEARIIRMVGNRIPGGIDTVEFNAQRFAKGAESSYSLIVVYRGSKPPGIGPGKTLRITLDDTSYEFTGNGSQRSTIIPGVVEETAFYHDIDPSILIRLAGTKTAAIEISGRARTITRRLTAKNLKAFNDFMIRQGMPSAP